MSDSPTMTILIATFNRADSLAETLAAISEADATGIGCQTVVVDNRCSDHTADVVAGFAGRMPVSRFEAGRPGKSCALNDALDELELGEIVVFADDDVTPCVGWMQAIRDSVRRWPDQKVFGGRIEPEWPDGLAPVGLRAPGARRWALGAHEHGSEECLYPRGETPVGMNWWVRREVLESECRFNESIGPKGTGVIMGEDTELLRRFLAAGLEIIHVPGALVRHRIDRDRLTDQALRKRAFAQGRGEPHVHGLCQPEMLRSHPRVWRMRRTLILWRARMRFVCASLGFSKEGRARRRLEALSDIGYGSELLRLARISMPDAEACKVMAGCGGKEEV